MYFFLFFFNDTATTEIYTLSLHDALPILTRDGLDASTPSPPHRSPQPSRVLGRRRDLSDRSGGRSEEHTSELQSPCNLVCRLLLEKKKKNLPLSIIIISIISVSKNTIGIH